MAQSSKRHRPPKILENTAQSSSKRQRPSEVLESEPGCTPSKKSSSHGATNKDDLDDVHKQVFNQKTLKIHIHMDIIQGKQKNNKDKQQQKYEKNDMRKSVCALRNSGGGVLIVRIIGRSEAGYSNKFHLVFDDMFKMYLFEDEKFGDVYQFQNIKDSISIFIQGSSKLVTTESNTKEPIPKGIDTITAPRLFNFFPLEKSRPSVIRSKWEPSRYKEDYIYEESDNIQFKAYRQCTDLKNIEHQLKDDIRDYVTAFTKAPTGGNIFFGIEEIQIPKNSKPVVLGFEISFTEDDIKHLNGCLKEIVTRKMYWLAMDHTSKIGFRQLTSSEIDSYYKIEFHLLLENLESKYVIELSVAHFGGIVFKSEEGPTAWELNENEEVCKMSLDRWYSLMNKDAANRQFREDNDNRDLVSRFRKLSISSSNLEAPYVYEIKHCVTSIRDSLFRMENPMTLTPEPLVNCLKTKCEGRMEEALKQLQMHPEFKRNRCIAVLDYDFSIILKENMDCPIQGSCNECIFVCDAFVVGPDNLPLLLSFCKICNDHDYCLSCIDAHNHKITRILTSKLRSHIRGLVGILSCTINILNDVNNQLKKALQQDQFYPEIVRLPGRRHSNRILLSFVETVASIPSPFKNIMDDYFLRSLMTNMRNMLTLDQYQILYNNYQSTRRLLVHGLPGTGKTEVIKEVIRKLSSSGYKREEILFVTEHIPLCDVVDEMAVCTTLTRYELNDMWNGNRADLLNVKHVFVDDAQFLDSKRQLPSGMNWFEQLHQIMPLDKDGKFWIFYGNHRYRNFGLTVENIVPTYLFEKRTLRSIIRNTKNIAKFAVKYASDDDYTVAVQSIPHDADGEDVIEHHRDLSTEDARYMAFQDELSDCLTRYKAGSIAVLFDKVSDIPSTLSCQTSSYRKRVHGLIHHSVFNVKYIHVQGHGKIKIVNASKNDDKDAVVVDSTRRYTSLDRLAVIAIGIDKPEVKIGYSTFTRPLAKLIVVHNNNSLQTV